MTKSSITERISAVLEEKGLKRGDFYQHCGIIAQNFFNWKMNSSIPAADTAIKMAEYLNVSVKWLITGEDDIKFRQDERELLEAYNQLDDARKKAALWAVKGMAGAISADDSAAKAPDLESTPPEIGLKETAVG